MSYYLAELETLKSRGKLRIPYRNRNILLVMIEDSVYAIQDKCPHMGASLYPGKIEGEVIYCKDHNLGISIKTGKIVNEKQAESLRLDEYSRYVKSFPITVSNGKVYLET